MKKQAKAIRTRGILIVIMLSAGIMGMSCLETLQTIHFLLHQIPNSLHYHHLHSHYHHHQVDDHIERQKVKKAPVKKSGKESKTKQKLYLYDSSVRVLFTETGIKVLFYLYEWTYFSLRPLPECPPPETL